METIFQSVYKLLKWVASITGFTYHEVNIILYFFLIPLLFSALIGNVLKKRKVLYITGITQLTTILLIPDFERFSTYLFEKSVAFLNWFNSIGLNYTQASVIICVFLPFLILTTLIYVKQKQPPAG